MILIYSFLAVVLAVLLKRRTVYVPAVRGFWLIATAVVAQTLVMNVFPAVVPHALASAVHLLTYAVAALFLALNLGRIPGFVTIAVGGGCNLVAILANGGVMPARPEALRYAGFVQEAGEFANSTAVEGARMWWFGDIFAIPSYLPFSNVFSVGDVILLFGAYIVFDRATAAQLATGGSQRSMSVADVIRLVQVEGYVGTGRDRVRLGMFLRAVEADATVGATTVMSSSTTAS